MTQDQIITLAQIYTMLLAIDTKDNMTMTFCLNNLKDLIIQLQREKGEK